MRSFSRKSLCFNCLKTCSGSCFTDPLPSLDLISQRSSPWWIKSVHCTPQRLWRQQLVACRPGGGKRLKPSVSFLLFFRPVACLEQGHCFHSELGSGVPLCLSALLWPPQMLLHCPKCSPNGLGGKSEGMQRWNNVLRGDVLISQICLWSSIIIFQTRAFPLKRLQISGQDTCFSWHRGKHSRAALTSKRQH